jgi:preprotein translocase subunit SecA
VQNGEVVIVDEFTGRLMSGPLVEACTRRSGEGRRADQRENQTLASITFRIISACT